VERPNRAHGHFWSGPLPIGGWGLVALVVVLTAVILLLLLVKDANGNFVY
jgi:hypothetical protein